MSEHMQPEIINGAMIIVDDDCYFPASVFSLSDALREVALDADGELIDGQWKVRVETGFWARLSAPGYMDCTEWVGPFETEAEALAELRERYADEEEEEEEEEEE